MHLLKRLIPQKSTKQLSVVDKCQSMKMEDDHWKDAKKRGSKVLVLFPEKEGEKGKGGGGEIEREGLKRLAKNVICVLLIKSCTSFKSKSKRLTFFLFVYFPPLSFLVLLFCFFFFHFY